MLTRPLYYLYSLPFPVPYLQDQTVHALLKTHVLDISNSPDTPGFRFCEALRQGGVDQGRHREKGVGGKCEEGAANGSGSGEATIGEGQRDVQSLVEASV